MLLVGVFVLRALDEAIDAAAMGIAHIPWRLLGEDAEAALSTKAISVRCLQTADRVLPDATTSEDELHSVFGRSY